VQSGKSQVRDLGIITATQGKSLREIVDRKVRDLLKDKHYRTKAPADVRAAMAATALRSPVAESRVGRAKMLRAYIQALK